MDGPGVEEIKRYLGLDQDPVQVLKPVWQDAALRRAVLATRGLRCVREDRWECLVNFLCSSMKQIVHIRALNRRLRQEIGNRRENDSLFPGPEEIAAAGEAKLRAIGLGYRARYVYETARLVSDGRFDLEELDAFATEEAGQKLRILPGVGEKIAHCVLLYGWRRFDAFPIDVWMARIMQALYYPERRVAPPFPLLHQKSRELFGPLRGLAQCHLFHYARTRTDFLQKKR